MTGATAYRDVPSVPAGLERLGEDLSDLPEEIAPVVAAVSRLHADNSESARTGADEALIRPRVQFSRLTAELGATRRALGFDRTMEAHMFTAPGQETPDPISQLYLAAEALRHIAETLPEDQGGLGLILSHLAAEIDFQTGRLEEDEEKA